MLSAHPSQNRRTPEGVRMFPEPLLLFRNAPRGLDRVELLQFARLLQGRVAGGGAFTCLVTDDREVRRLNLQLDRKSTRLNSSHTVISYAVFCLKKKRQHVRRLARTPGSARN